MYAGGGRYFLLLGFSIALLHHCHSAPANFTSDFEKSCTIKVLKNGVDMPRFVSKRTGFNILVMEEEGPMVNGYLKVATEPSADYGFPYVLNSLILNVGAEGRPFYGSFHPIAKKLLAAKYGVESAEEFSLFSTEVAGSEGFLRFLKQFMNQITHPFFTDSAMKTDVHHINGEGEDSGTAYNVVSGLKSNPAKLMKNIIKSEFYQNFTGYITNLDETLENIRNLNVDHVREYHRKFYRPENMELLVVGQVDHEELLAVVHEIEDKHFIPMQGNQDHVNISPSPLNHNVHRNISLPMAADEQLSIGFRLKDDPSRITIFATEVLANFMGLGVIFKAKLCDPLKGNFNVTADNDGSIIIHWKKCSDSQATLDSWMKSFLQSFTNGTFGIPNHLIEYKLKNMKFSLEEKSSFIDVVTKLSVHGSTCDNLRNRITSHLLDELLQKPDQYWKDLIEQEILHLPKVYITSVHSDDQESSHSAESTRIQERIEKLGEEGLLKLEEELQAAKKINEIPVPLSLIEETEIPDLSKIPFHHLESYSNIKSINNKETSYNSSAPHLNIANFPYKFIVDDVKSSKVKMYAIFDTSNLTKLQTQLVPFIWDLLENSVRNETRKDLLKFMMGIYEALSKTYLKTKAAIYIETNEVAAELYEEKVSQLYDVIYSYNFTASRDYLRDVFRAAKDLSIVFNDSSADELFFRNRERLEELADQVSPVEYFRKFPSPPKEMASFMMEKSLDDFMEELKELLSVLTSSERVVFYMVTNLNKLAETTDINAPWERFLNRNSTKTDFNLNVVHEREVRTLDSSIDCFGPEYLGIRRINSSMYEKDLLPPKGDFFWINSTNNYPEENEVNCSPSAYIQGIHGPHLRNSNIQVVSRSFEDDFDEDIAALLTIIEYMKQKEGPLFGEIMDLADSFDVRLTVRTDNKTENDGTLSIEVKGAPHPVRVYQAITNIFRGYLNGSQEFDRILVDLAKSKAITSSISKEKTLNGAIKISMQSYFQIAVKSRDLMHLINNLTLADVQRVFEKYFNRLVTSEESFILILCPSSQDAEIETQMKRLGIGAVTTTGAVLITDGSYHYYQNTD